jgi:hypothetical protein
MNSEGSRSLTMSPSVILVNVGLTVTLGGVGLDRLIIGVVDDDVVFAGLVERDVL